MSSALAMTGRILIVDDDPTMRLLLREALAPEGLVVVDAEDGVAALERFDSELPDLVLLDVQMPGLDGFEVCEAIRHKPGAEHTPVVMMTGREDVEAIRRSYEAGATDFVTKPLNWLILRHRIRYLLRASENVDALRRSEEQLANAQRLARIGNFQFDLATGALDGSDEYRAILELPRDDKPVPSEKVREIIHPEDREDVEQALRTCIEERSALHLDFRIRLEDGAEKILHAQGRLRFDVSERPTWLEGTIQDVTERRRAEEQIRYVAHHDGLTGLGNRLLFKERLALALSQARRSDSVLGILFLDLDHFKRINDTLGHSVGDHLLRGVADRLVKSVREVDMMARRELESAVSRLGGDEFTVLVSGVADAQDLAKVARRILDSLSRPFMLDGHEVVISGSIGITAWPHDGDDVETLLRNADTAMYHAKEQGRNNYQFYAESMNAVALRQLIIEGKLRRALEQGEFEVHYQPKIALGTGALTGFEALVRWRDPDLGLVMPGVFIPIAEETGLIAPLGEWVLREACRQVARWREAGLPEVPVSVNLSTHQFRSGRLAERVIGIVRETCNDPKLLEIEITESTLLHDERTVVCELQDLRAAGVRIAVDDFGTGYSSLSYLRRLPVDSLKVDRSFITEIETNPEDAALCAAIVSMGRALRLRVIAEGVETEAQRALLATWGCDEFQGFLVSPAVPPGDLGARLGERWRS